MPRLLLLLVIGLLALGAAACGSDDDEEPATSAEATATAEATAGRGRLRARPARARRRRQADRRHRQARLPAVLRGRRPDERQGLRERGRLRGRRASSASRKDQVKWTVVPFNSSYAPGPKKFDFDINQISITPKRAERVDFSTPYYTAPQAVVALKDSDAASATSLADLADAKLGVQVGTTSLDAVTEVIKPSTQPQVFNDSNDTVRALKAKRVDAIVVDLPTAFYLTAAEIPEAKITGQFDAPGGDDWGLVLAKDSELTACVDQAIEALDELRRARADHRRVDGRPGRRARAAIAAPLPQPSARRLAREAARRRRSRRQARDLRRLDGGRARPARRRRGDERGLAERARRRSSTGRTSKTSFPDGARRVLARRQAVRDRRDRRARRSGCSSRSRASRAPRRCSRCGCCRPCSSTCSAASRRSSSST